MSARIRKFFSGNRNRYSDGEFNLDLTYITDRIIAMGYPSVRLESLYRNNIYDVAKMLKKKHGNNYLVLNLSGREYDTTVFGCRVISAGFPDHQSPPLCLMWCLYSIIDYWLALDKENVVAIHCLAGKGRTGLAICCTLLMQGFFNNTKRKSTLDIINTAINYFHDMRGDGVENPDQIRFIYQFLQSSNSMGSDMLLQASMCLQPTVFISDMILYNVPIGTGGIVMPSLRIYLKKHNTRDIVYNTFWGSKENQILTSFQQTIILPINQYITGDLLFIFYDNETPLFHLSLCTLFLPQGTFNHPSSIYLNHTCISFERDCHLPFSSSFSLQLLSYHEKKKPTQTQSSFITTQAISEERLRRVSSLPFTHSFIHSSSSSSSVNLSSVPSGTEPPMLWRGAKEPDSSMNLSLAFKPEDYHIILRHSLSAPSSPIPTTHTAQITRHHSLSDDFDVHSSTFSHLSLMYNQEHVPHTALLHTALPQGKERIGCIRPLREEEIGILQIEDELFVDSQPVDRIVQITGRTESPRLSVELFSEIIMRHTNTPSPRLSYMGSWELSSTAIRGVVFAGFGLGKECKRRFIVLTECSVRVMTGPDCRDLKCEIKWNEIDSIVFGLKESPNNRFCVCCVNVENSQEFCFSLKSFDQAVQFLLLCRSLCHLPSPPLKPTLSSPPGEFLQWILYLYSPELLPKLSDMSGSCDVHKMLNDLWGVSREMICTSSKKLIRYERMVIGEDCVMSTEDYLLERNSDEEEVGGSVRMIVDKLRGIMSEEFFQRLVQISAIDYPSPIPLLREVIRQENEDWCVLFEQCPDEFLQTLQRCEVLKRSSLSCRSFV